MEMTNTINAYEVVAKVAQITAPFANAEGFEIQVGDNGNVRVAVEIRKRYESLYVHPTANSIVVVHKGYYENRDDFRKEVHFDSVAELTRELEVVVTDWK